MTLTPADVAARALSTITVTDDLVVRDLTVKRALAAGVTAAITGGGDYAASQALADALQGTADGVRYRVRHDLSARLIAIAWFGDVGGLSRLPRATSTAIPDSVVDEARRQFGYEVLPPPL